MSDPIDTIDRLLEQLAGTPAAVDAASVRLRARRMRRSRFVRHVGAAAVAVAAALALSQSMIGDATRSDDTSAGPAAAAVEPAPDHAVVDPRATAVPRALPAAPRTPAPRPGLAAGSWGTGTTLVPLLAGGANGVVWARDRAFDLVAPADAPLGTPVGDGVTAVDARRVTTW